MKIKMRDFLLLIFLFLTISVLASCTGNQRIDQKLNTTEEAIPSGTEKNPVTLTTVSMFGGTDANAENYQSICEQFITKYPYVTIEDDSQSADQDWKTKIAADFAVGNEPDVIQFFTDANASDVLAAGKFVTITEIRAVYPEYAADTLASALAAASNPDGVERAVPTTGYWEGLFCNQDLFEQYGLELPTDWEKLLLAITTFHRNGVTPIAVSLNNIPHYWIEYLMLSSAGAASYTSVPTTAPEDWCRGLAMFQTLREMGAFPEDTDTIDNDYANELFRKKKAAMQLEGSWYAKGIPDQVNTVVLPFPVLPDGKAASGSMVGGISSGFYITRKAWEDPEKRDAAVKFVMAHTGKDAVSIYWGGNGQAAVKLDPPADMTPLGRSGLNYSNSAVSISTPTDSRITQEAYNTLVMGIVDLSTGKISAEELLNKALKINAHSYNSTTAVKLQQNGDVHVQSSNY